MIREGARRVAKNIFLSTEGHGGPRRTPFLIRGGARRAAKNIFLSTKGQGGPGRTLGAYQVFVSLLRSSSGISRTLVPRIAMPSDVNGPSGRWNWGTGAVQFWGEGGRHKACPYGGHGGRLGGTMWLGDRRNGQYAGDAAPTWHGVGGALRGESPRTELQGSVVSGQWSVRLRNAGGEGLAQGTVKGAHKGCPYGENGIGGFQDGKGHPRGVPLR